MSPGGEARSCPRCGAHVAAGQEYCLECGLRLPGGGLSAAVGTTWRQRVAVRAPNWAWPIVGALVLAAAMTAVAIGIAQGGGEAAPYFEATGPSTLPTPTTTEPTEPTAPTETEPPAPPPRPQIVDWPSQNGWTVVIASIPTTGGRAVAVRKAREVLASDLPEVGVLDSGEFSSLHPGYYVVFSGVYANQRAALEAVAEAQRLYPAAYVRQISR